jgi:hypothetical protein
LLSGIAAAQKEAAQKWLVPASEKHRRRIAVSSSIELSFSMDQY